MPNKPAQRPRLTLQSAEHREDGPAARVDGLEVGGGRQRARTRMSDLVRDNSRLRNEDCPPQDKQQDHNISDDWARAARSAEECVATSDEGWRASASAALDRRVALISLP